jgi:hypothetical protein
MQVRKKRVEVQRMQEVSLISAVRKELVARAKAIC